jgi:hypothetical protein
VPEARREFRLPSSDEDYLNGLGVPWEAVRQGNQQWLLIHNWKVPAGYSAQVVILALLIDPNYPDTQLDSFYVFPGLQRIDAGAIKNTTGESTLGKVSFSFNPGTGRQRILGDLALMTSRCT